MSAALGWFGAYFFLIVAVVAMVLSFRKKEPKRAFGPISIGGIILSGILFHSAVGGGDWDDLNMFHYSITLGCLMFFGGVAAWGFHHLKRKDEGPKR